MSAMFASASGEIRRVGKPVTSIGALWQLMAPLRSKLDCEDYCSRLATATRPRFHAVLREKAEGRPPRRSALYVRWEACAEVPSFLERASISQL